MKNSRTIIALLISFLLIGLAIILHLININTDLKDTVNMYENTIDVCKIDLEKVQIENEELRKQIGKE